MNDGIERLPALLERAGALTDDEVRLLAKHWSAHGVDGPSTRRARAASRGVANRLAIFLGRKEIWIMAGNDAWAASWRDHNGNTASAVRDAAWALTVGDVLRGPHFERLTAPWRAAGLPL